MRDKPKAITCISVGRGEVVGTASINLGEVEEDIMDDLNEAGSR